MRHASLYSTSLALCLTLLLASRAQAQYGFRPLEEYAIEITNSDGSQAIQLGTGGYNNVQVSSADVRGTGQPRDYYVFDRAGDVHTVLSTDPAGGTTLVDLSALTRDWPRARFFSLMRDYNQDGVPDLFVSSAESGREGICVYTGRRVGDRITFERADFGGIFGEVLAYGSTSGEQLLYSLRTDIPAIQDLDGDGDLDILSFDASGSYIWYYRNISTGATSNPSDHLKFELASRCYGGIYENSFSAEIVLASSPGVCAQPFAEPGGADPVARGGVHPGSTVTPYDADCDGDLDLLVGDVAASSIALLTNTPGPGGEAFFGSVETNWPSGAAAPAVDLDFFPAAFVIAPLGSGMASACPQAVLIAPSNTGGGEDRQAQLYYAQDESNRLVQSTQSLFSGASFDHGTGSHFAFADLTGDGLPDLLVGNESSYNPALPVPRQSSLRYYRATGPQAYREEAPTWLVNLNAVLPQEYLSLDPVFADLTGDGRPDLLIGNSEGGISFVENRSTGTSVSFAPAIVVWQGINVGIQSSPAVADVNGDGLLDLVIGERAGNLNLFLNRGSQTAPSFPSAPDDDFYGQIDVRTPGFNSSALSRPAFFQTSSAPLTLYVGSGQGRLLVYGELPGARGGKAILLTEIDARVGNQLDPALQSISSTEDQTGFFWLGNQRGGFSAFATDGVVSAGNPIDATSLRLYPNPSEGRFSISELPANEPFRYEILDVTGRQLTSGSVLQNSIDEVLPKGAYLLKLSATTSSLRYVSKLIIQ